MLHVKPIQGEQTRFYVEAQTLQCTNCNNQASRTPYRHIYFGHRQKAFLQQIGVWGKVKKVLDKVKDDWKDDGQCRKCGHVLEPRWHQVDIALWEGNGQCSCEFFAYTLGPLVRKLDKAQRSAGLHRCLHIDAAREFAVDLAIKMHERQRLKGKKEIDE